MTTLVRAGIAWAIVVMALLVAVLPTLAPSGTDAIDLDRAVEHVESIASKPHEMGTPEIARVREYLVDQIEQMGLEPVTQTVDAPDYFGSPHRTVEVTNVMTRIAGTESTDAIVFVAHHDTVPRTPGANDNAAAVAALLEVGRVLATQPGPNDVILLFTDGEEPTPRFGASAFVEHEWFEDVRLAVNLEGIGIAGPSVLVEVNGPAPELAARFSRAVDRPVAYSFLTRTAELIGGAATDFDVFKARDVNGYSFAYMRGSSIYHTEADSIEALHVGGMAHHADISLGIARDPGPLDIADDGGDAVFFTVPGGILVRYGSSVALLVALVAVAVAWLSFTRRGDGGDMWYADLVGFLRALGVAFASALVVTVAWMGIASLRSGMGMVESYLWLLAMVALVGAMWHRDHTLARRRGKDPTRSTLIVWIVLATLTALWLPEMSPLFAWPLLATAVALAFQPRSDGWRLAAFGGAALVTLVVVAPAVDLLFVFATPRPGNPGSSLPYAVVVPLLLVALTVGLLATVWPKDPAPGS